MTTDTSPQALLDLSFAHVAARSLHLVAELGVADHLDAGPREVTDLASEVGVQPDPLHRLLRLLEARGVFARDGEGRWSHTGSSRLLRSDHPMSLRGFVRMAGTPFGWSSFTELDHALRTGTPGICRLEPEGWTAYLRSHPQEGAIFQEAMAGKAHDDIAVVLEHHDFSAYERVVDVAGGHGHLIRAVLSAHDRVTGVLFELPEVTAHVAPQDRLTVVAGDFFTDPLPVADAYVLMNIVHDWDDEAAVRILRAVADAGRSRGAAVLVVETVLPDGPAPHWAKTLDVMMLAMTGGRERTLAEYAALLDAAGVDLGAVVPTTTPFSVLEGRVPADVREDGAVAANALSAGTRRR